MSQTSFPGKIASLTSEWLTQVLRTNGVLQNSAVTTFTVKPISGGYTSLVYHLELKYDDIVQNAPPSLVVKFHGNSASTRAQFEALGIYEKEVRFYQTLARENTLPVPLCYAAEFDENSGDFVLLLEDLSAARPGSWVDDPVGDIREALTHLARIHAKFWGDSRLEHYDWIVHPIVAELDVDQRRQHEESLIDHYYSNLCQLGVSDLTRERLGFQCKLSLLWLHFMQFNVVVQPDLLQALKADAEAEGDDWRDWVFGQLGPATEDWKLSEVIDQAIDEARSIRT